MNWPRELGWALRGFRRQPAFHLLCALTLAVGVGATVAAFSVLDAVVLRPLPYPSSDRLVWVGTSLTFQPGVGPLSEAAAAAFVERSHTLDAFAAVEPATRVLRGEGDPLPVASASVSPGFFSMLGARAAIGRLFTEADHAPAAAPVVILASSTWRSRYGGRTGVIGTTVTLDSVAYEIAGVLAPDFVAPEALLGGTAPTYWTPLALNGQSRGAFNARGLGLLGDGASAAGVARELTLLQEQAYGGRLPSFVRGATAVDLRAATVGDVGRILWLIFGALGLLLAIACTNVSNLVLARATDRMGEVAVRRALGATSARLARQFVAEGVAIALAGGIAGALLAHALVQAFVALNPGGVPRIAEVALDLRGVAVAFIAVSAAGIVFGLIPALGVGGTSQRPGTGHGSRASLGKTGARVRGGLVIAETAMAILLVLTASLLARSFQHLASVDPGFDPARLISAVIQPGPGRSAEQARAFQEALVERLRASPGIRAAAFTDALPFAGEPVSDSYTPEGARIRPDESIYIATTTVSNDFFATLGLRVREGRTFDGRDRAGSEPVIVVNEALAAAHWPGERNVVGRRIKSGTLTTADEGWFRIVGVVSNARYALPLDPAPTIYRPMSQHPSADMMLLARFEGAESAAIASLRAAVRLLDSELPVRSVSTLGDLATASLGRQRFYTLLGAGFGVLALLLAVVGTYGVATYVVMRRTREIGIRMALGARRNSVALMFVRESLRLTLSGVAIGLALAMTGRRLLQGFLFGVAPADPATIVLAAFAVLATAALAAWIPARRAARSDPAGALRFDG